MSIKNTIFFCALGSVNFFCTFEKMESLLVFVPKKSSRVRYVFRLVFNDLLKLPFSLTSDLDAFQSSDSHKLVYAEKPWSDDLFFKSSGLLFQRGIDSIELNAFDYEGLKAFFPVHDADTALPFDVFSSIFYLVSRYEEYQPYVPDKYGRFTAHLSVSSRLGILQKPMVNIWALMVKKIIQDRYPTIVFPVRHYRFVPTYDIDSAFAYRQKGLVRSMGGYLLALKDLDWEDMYYRTRVLFGRARDPFDTFDLQIEYQKKYQLKPVYFILFGHYGQYDKNINTRNRTFRFLIKRIHDYARIGIHPSYNTGEFPKLLHEEISLLEKVVNNEITISRQHFLRLMLPHTYRNLIEEDISDDYTMGYAALPGFRAGICDSYHFYDLDMEVETKLRIHPFMVMDGTLRDYMKLTPADAIAQIAALIEEVRKVNGTFISLWHNESLSEEKRWKGWRTVYETLIQKALP
ncbi:MAG: hypothetical protein COW63_02200 [Bacteroidetes bacterium CG18_big_fil_WC_8_21_14_2_50_41_14]|nr:MAG: hypothetical protein COW63_02200 [Bacteroidetes bacterium CG18_big_fil_WC_8_21_14_2_50_41_14]PJB55427.1 MAG: hypothetical protein CO098_16355 [Bacteroidetes bacterium CG_4_9_14_3_um_filter_41_19]